MTIINTYEGCVVLQITDGNTSVITNGSGYPVIFDSVESARNYCNYNSPAYYEMNRPIFVIIQDAYIVM